MIGTETEDPARRVLREFACLGEHPAWLCVCRISFISTGDKSCLIPHGSAGFEEPGLFSSSPKGLGTEKFKKERDRKEVETER